MGRSSRYEIRPWSERFLPRVDRRGPDECWPWLGAHGSKGYGAFSIRGKSIEAHRAAYLLWIGPIPEGHHIDHVRDRGCVLKDCCNPRHLEAVTPLENLRRARRPDHDTHCARGHEYATTGVLLRCAECNRKPRTRRRKTVGVSV